MSIPSPNPFIPCFDWHAREQQLLETLTGAAALSEENKGAASHPHLQLIAGCFSSVGSQHFAEA